MTCETIQDDVIIPKDGCEIILRESNGTLWKLAMAVCSAFSDGIVSEVTHGDATVG